MSRGPFHRRHLVGGVLAFIVAAGAACAPDEESPPSLPAQAIASEAFTTLPLPELAFPGEMPPGAPERVVCLVPSVTELIYTLGLGDRLVGRSHWCDWPPEVRTLPDLGKLESFSKERIVDLEPDLVVLFSSFPDLARSLEDDFGIRVVMPPTQDREEIYEGIAQVAAALGVPERGRILLDHLTSELERVRESASGLPRVRVLVALDRKPLYVPGPTSFVHELLEIAGAANVAAGLRGGSAWPTASLEQVFDWNPEVIIDLSVGERPEEAIASGRSYWSRFPWIDAVAKGRVSFLEAGVLVRPGPRMAKAAALLKELVHGT